MIRNGWYAFTGEPCKLRQWPYGPFLELEPGKIYRITYQGRVDYKGSDCLAVYIREASFPFRHANCLYGSEEKFNENWSR